jgi:hypothetical protein
MNAWAAVFLVLLWLPGHLVLRLCGVPRAPRPAFSFMEKLFGETAISFVLLLWIGVTLALLGLFTPPLLAGCAALPAVVLALLLHRRGGALVNSPSFRLDGTLLVVIGLVVVGWQWYQPAFEQVVGARDPITYVVSGAHLARTGTWVSHDEIVTTIPEQHRVAFLGLDYRTGKGHWGSRLQGWYLMDPDTGRVVPQGLPLYPAAIAFVYLAGGIQAALRVTTVLAVAAVVALFFLGRRWLNPAVGLSAALLLLVSPAQVWFSRYANAETAAQLLVLLGLYGLVVYRRHGGWGYGLLAAAGFGLSWMAHIWMVWLVLPLGAVLIIDLLRGRVDREALLAFWLPLVALGLQTLLVYFAVTTAYLWGVYLVFKWTLPAVIPIVVVGTALLVTVGIWGRQRAAADGRAGAAAARSGAAGARSNAAAAPSGAHPAQSAPPARQAGPDATGGIGWLRHAIAAAVAGAAVYGYWLRPMLSNAWSAEAVPRLVLAVTFAVFGFAVAGVVVLLLDRRRSTVTLCLLAIALGVIVPVLWEPQIIRTLMWSLRRYQSFLPLVFLFAAVPLWLQDRSGRRDPSPRAASSALALQRGVGAVVTLFLLVPLATQGAQYRGFKEPGDAVKLIDSIAATLEDDAVLIFEARSGWGALELAPALAYWKGFDVVYLQHKETDAAALQDFARRQAQAGRPMYFFTQGFNYYVDQPRMVPHRRWWFERRQLEEVIGRMPVALQSSRMPLSVYRVEASGRNGPLDGMLDVGHWDDIYVGEALPWEATGDLTARWTKGNGFFWLPGLTAGTEQIIVHAGTVQNSGAFNRTLTATLDGLALGEFPLQQDWTDYVFDVPSDWRPAEGAAPRLTLTTQALQPDAVNGNGDTRYLGVFVNAILWR